MSTQSRVSPAAVAAAVDDTPTPTPTHYQQMANDFLKGLEELGISIPNLEVGHQDIRRFVRTHSGYPLAFLRTTVSAVEQSQDLQVVKRLDPVKGRDDLQFIDAFIPVLDAVSKLYKALRFTIDSRKANLAADCLQIMAIAGGLGRDPNSAVVAEHHATMRRDLGRRRRKKNVAEPSTQAAAEASEPRTNAARMSTSQPVTG
jgi:hypothetical protein